jgi:HD-GYP domain-containing protein (c-di-GMP phosphodiesterase class II)
MNVEENTMNNQPPLVIPIFDLVLCLSQAVDLVSPLVADHHKRTAQIAYGLGMQMKLPKEELHDLIIAAALHDVGGLTQKDRIVALDFEYQDPYGHAVMGYLLLKTFSLFRTSADIVRFHHVPWMNGVGAALDGIPVPRASHILQLADRIAVLLDVNADVLQQVDGILEKIRAQSGERFIPEQVQALEVLAEKEAFWLDTIYLQHLNVLSRRLNWDEIQITETDFLGLTNLFRRIIDFRSQFTASHSAGVAAVAETLAQHCGFSFADQRMIHLAGLMHDLGKLAVPAEILEKQGKLTTEEFAVMRRHTYYTFHLLEPLKVLDVIRIWGAYHHERMDGHGYPFHLDENELPLGSRIVSVADIFTAITEDRPYRAGMKVNEAFQILADAASQHRLDKQVVDTLHDHIDEINETRRLAQTSALEEYQKFITEADALTHQSALPIPE